MINGTHTSKKRRSKGKPHIFLDDDIDGDGWDWGGYAGGTSRKTFAFCNKLNKARTIEGKWHGRIR